ncbi:LysM peptidoglycan-binding domain-containing protein [Nocardioides euryhalodurans]|uniref:LysM peptidoglycan-binding domain-containing protein n=1 Tax=Nocardioides euryhalodurans TaxID=2518370 RepID=A0A4P7GJT6_9ACTN|nr:LysM peptidoglycan-binding domain-containing protein [Nocardioides euryhalodurans]QBR92280.1 LysM peptidoglycan-binding domain-containing protein [Nocardioides euryhalodurans]
MSTMTLSPTPTITSAVRLTRRGRLVVFAAGLLVVLALGVLWGSGSVATERPGTPESTLVVQVEPGDTLYDLAASITTEGDVNAMVERIEDLNRLDSAVLYAGQKLRVPTS